MSEDIPLPSNLPAVARKKVSAAFDGGRITSDGGVMLLAQAERRLGIADRLARVIPDGRDADRVVHLLPDILRARIFAIACGYEDADDLDRLRLDPAFKLACGRLPDTGRDLCSQPTVSRWENAPSLRDLIRLMGVMVDIYCASYAKPSARAPERLSRRHPRRRLCRVQRVVRGQSDRRGRLLGPAAANAAVSRSTECNARASGQSQTGRPAASPSPTRTQPQGNRCPSCRMAGSRRLPAFWKRTASLAASFGPSRSTRQR